MGLRAGRGPSRSPTAGQSGQLSPRTEATKQAWKGAQKVEGRPRSCLRRAAPWGLRRIPRVAAAQGGTGRAWPVQSGAEGHLSAGTASSVYTRVIHIKYKIQEKRGGENFLAHAPPLVRECLVHILILEGLVSTVLQGLQSFCQRLSWDTTQGVSFFAGHVQIRPLSPSGRLPWTFRGWDRRPAASGPPLSQPQPGQVVLPSGPPTSVAQRTPSFPGGLGLLPQLLSFLGSSRWGEARQTRREVIYLVILETGKCLGFTLTLDL